MLASVAVALTFDDLLKGLPKKPRRQQKAVLKALKCAEPSLWKKTPKELEKHIQGLSADLLGQTVRATSKELVSRLLDQGRRKRDGMDFEEIGKKAADLDYDLEFTVNGTSIKDVNLVELSSAAEIAQQINLNHDTGVELSAEMAVVISSLDKPQLKTAIFNQPLFDWALDRQKNGWLSDVSDELLESSLILSGFVVSECLKGSSSGKIDYREILENAALGFTASRVTEGAIEFFTS